jgi:hypothetical protein
MTSSVTVKDSSSSAERAIGAESDNSAPDVSVIIPLFDRARLVRYTLACLAPEKHPGVHIEVIIVDDGSSDGGPESITAAFPSVRVLRQARCGAPVARNRGLDAASANSILLLDSDDLIEPGFFRPRLEALRVHPQADGAYGPWDHFASNAEWSPTSIVPRHTPYPIEASVDSKSHLVRLLGGWYIAPQTILWRSSTLQRVGGQDAALPVNQDVDLLFRVLTTGSGLVGCDAPRALVREHAGERQGVIGESREKVESMLALRRQFVEVLRSSGELDSAGEIALSRFCFDQWRRFRLRFPEVAAGFLQLSRELDPELMLRGRWPLTLLAKLIGPVQAAVLRDALLKP